MQTFVPDKSYSKSASILDDRRLLKQRVEAMQILLSLLATPGSRGWQSHPAVAMWRGSENCLCYYGLAMCGEATHRGFRDSLHGWFARMSRITGRRDIGCVDPRWIGSSIHEAHRQLLVEKAVMSDDVRIFEHYCRVLPDDMRTMCLPTVEWPEGVSKLHWRKR